MHVAPLLFAGEKMSKSLGNLVFAKDLLGRYEPAVIRLSLMYYHYRIGGEWQPALLDRAQALWSLLQTAAHHMTEDCAAELAQRARAAIDNDLDTHQILHALKDAAHDTQATGNGSGAGTLKQTLELLGLQS